MDERAPEQIADAVCRLIDNPELARTLAQQGQDHAVEHSSRAARAQVFSELFAQLLAGACRS